MVFFIVYRTIYSGNVASLTFDLMDLWISALIDSAIVWISKDEVARQRGMKQNAERDGYRADSEDHQQKPVSDEGYMLPGDAVRRATILFVQSTFSTVERLADPRQRLHQLPLQPPRPTAVRRLRHVMPESVSGSGFSITPSHSRTTTPTCYAEICFRFRFLR